VPYQPSRNAGTTLSSLDDRNPIGLVDAVFDAVGAGLVVKHDETAVAIPRPVGKKV